MSSKENKRPRTNKRPFNGTLVYTDVKRYDKAKETHRQYLNAFNDYVNALNKYKAIEPSQHDEIKTDPLGFLENTILETYKDRNLMGLSYEKLIDVLQIDVNVVTAKALFLSRLPKSKQPLLNQFEVYTDNEVQEVRLKALNKILEGVNDLKEVEHDFTIQQIKSSLLNALKGRLVTSMYNVFEPIPNYKYVINGKVF